MRSPLVLAVGALVNLFLVRPALLALFLAWTASTIWAEGLTGVFIVAKRALDDPHFGQSVVLVARHDDDGAIGVIINRPTELRLSEVFPDNKVLRESGEFLYFGGPVLHMTLAFVFRSATKPEDALSVLEDIYASQELDLLTDLLNRHQPTTDVRVFAGYAGWAPGQLEGEIARGDWYVTPADARTIFAADPTTIWPELIQRASARSVDVHQHQIAQTRAVR